MKPEQRMDVETTVTGLLSFRSDVKLFSKDSDVAWRRFREEFQVFHG